MLRTSILEDITKDGKRVPVREMERWQQVLSGEAVFFRQLVLPAVLDRDPYLSLLVPGSVILKNFTGNTPKYRLRCQLVLFCFVSCTFTALPRKCIDLDTWSILPGSRWTLEYQYNNSGS